MKATKTVTDYMRDLRHATTLDDLRRVRRSMPDVDDVTHEQLYAATVARCRELVAEQRFRDMIECERQSGEPHQTEPNIDNP